MKHIFKNKRNILIMMFALVVIMGIGFAAYSQQLKINETSSIDSNWDVYIKSVDAKSTKGGATGNGTVDSKTAASLTTDLKYPGDNVIYNITVANDGSIDAILEKINFNMEKENTVIKYYYSVDDEATWNEVTKASENPYDVDLLANTTDEFQVKVEYDPTKTGTATADQKSNKLTLNLDYVQKTGGGTVVPSNNVSFGGQTVTLASAGSDGLYADEYEEGRYIYKGANPDNYITFNDETWRILSVESDGTVKIIRNESIGSKVFDPGYDTKIIGVTNSASIEGTRYTSSKTDYCYYSTSMSGYKGCNVWGSSSTMLDANGKNITKMQKELGNSTTYDLPSEEAYLNTYLNEIWYNDLSEKSKSLVKVNIWNVGVLDHKSNQKFEVDLQQESAYKWKGKIGLITPVDYVKTNTNTELCGNVHKNHSTARKYTICRTTNWLFNSKSYWSISPYSGSDTVWHIESIGYTNYINSANVLSLGVRPALYLIPNITLSGEGTSSNPYTIN